MTVAIPKNGDAFSPNQSVAPSPKPARISLSQVVPDKSREMEANYLAHDARNWLTVLRVYCDLLRTSGVVASGYEKWIEELSSAVERGHGLVASLLDTVKEIDSTPARQVNASDSHPASPVDNRYRASRLLDSSSLNRRWPATTLPTPMAEILDVGAAITRRLPLLEHLAGGKIHVEIDVPPKVGNVILSESAFERILHNLVGNAIEAMPKGGRLSITLRRGNRNAGRARAAHPTAGAKNVRLKTLKKNDRRSGETSSKPVAKTLLLRVHDTGEGIAQERLSSIFDAGVSGRAAQKHYSQPRGFGLAIVRELTQRAGGAARVRSHIGRGTCFEIELPRI